MTRLEIKARIAAVNRTGVLQVERYTSDYTDQALFAITTQQGIRVAAGLTYDTLGSYLKGAMDAMRAMNENLLPTA